MKLSIIISCCQSSCHSHYCKNFISNSLIQHLSRKLQYFGLNISTSLYIFVVTEMFRPCLFYYFSDTQTFLFSLQTTDLFIVTCILSHLGVSDGTSSDLDILSSRSENILSSSWKLYLVFQRDVLASFFCA